MREEREERREKGKERKIIEKKEERIKRRE